MAAEYIKMYLGYQSYQVVEQQVNLRFKNHLCSHHQKTSCGSVVTQSTKNRCLNAVCIQYSMSNNNLKMRLTIIYSHTFIKHDALEINQPTSSNLNKF